MKKIITILLTAAMLFAFVACAPVTDSKPPVDNNSGTGNNQTNKDPFSNIASTLTIPVTNLDDIDFTGTWDFMKDQILLDSDSSGHSIAQGYKTITEDKVSTTYTYWSGTATYVKEEDYEEEKAARKELMEQYKDSFFQFDDEKKSITDILEKDALKDLYYEESFDDFLYSFHSYEDRNITITTNETKTALKIDTVYYEPEIEGYSNTESGILIKR